VELAKPFFDGQQLVQDDREPAGHEASARSLHTLHSVLSHFLLSFCCCFIELLMSAAAVQYACNRHEHYCMPSRPQGSVCACRGAPGKGLVAPLVHLLVSGGPSDQARAARALSNMATDSAVKEQIVAAGMFAFSCVKTLSAMLSKETEPIMFRDASGVRSVKSVGCICFRIVTTFFCCS
jgi:hypothetical protein